MVIGTNSAWRHGQLLVIKTARADSSKSCSTVLVVNFLHTKPLMVVQQAVAA